MSNTETAVAEAPQNEVTVRPAAQLKNILERPDIQQQIKTACAGALTPERLTRIMLTGFQKTPALQECSPGSFVLCALEAAELGIEPNGVLGHAYLVPFRNKNTRRKEAQFMLGYRGMIELGRRSGQLSTIYAELVYEGDKFEVKRGLHPDLIHVPNYDADRSDDRIIGAYAVAMLKDGSPQFEYMPKRDINKIRAGSKAANNGPWVDHYGEMAKKTVLRRLFKMLPCSIVVQNAVMRDELRDLGIIGGDDYIDAESSVVRKASPNSLDEAAAMLESPNDPDTGEVHEAEAVQEPEPESEPENSGIDIVRETVFKHHETLTKAKKLSQKQWYAMCDSAGILDAQSATPMAVIKGADFEQLDRLSTLLGEVVDHAND